LTQNSHFHNSKYDPTTAATPDERAPLARLFRRPHTNSPPNNPNKEFSMIRRLFLMLRDWKRGPVKHPVIHNSDTLGFSNCGFGAIGE
jgi:hypothetical protein